MALDGMFLRLIKSELEAQIGSRISQIYQPNRDELVFILRGFSGSKKLLLSARANSPRINFCTKTPENPAQPPMLCMLLRKRLGGGKLTAVRQLECDRVIFLDFECVNELGDTVMLTVVCEIMGMYSNVILTDSNGVIIDSLKRVDLTMSSRRLVLPNIKYEPPEGQNKTNLLTAQVTEAVQRITELDEEMPLDKAILKAVQGVSPIVCREIAYRVMPDATNRLGGILKSRLIEELDRLKQTVLNCDASPCIVYREDSKPFDFCFMPIEQYGQSVRIKSFDSCSMVLDEFYDERDSRERMRVKSQSLTKLLNNTAERLSRKIEKQKAELKRCENREELRICGDLLQANLYRVEKGAPFVEVENFYDESYGTKRIFLDPALSPASNAQKYYKDYRKAKNAEKVLAEQIVKARYELMYIESVLDEVSRAENEGELSGIKEELADEGYIKSRSTKRKKTDKLPPLEYTSSDGFRILVGRNNRQNDQLTLKTASKNDVWLHTKEIHGSHTVIISDGKAVSDNAILQAAQLAAYHSKARNSSKVPVDYTLIKYVSKPSGAKPGMVIYVNNKTVYVTPKDSADTE